MTVEKRNRLVAAVTVNVILLIFILAAVVVYQLVVIATASAELKQIKEDIGYYEQLIEESESNLEYLNSYENLLKEAMKRNYRFPND